jgi:hypothetical protein
MYAKKLVAFLGITALGMSLVIAAETPRQEAPKKAEAKGAQAAFPRMGKATEENVKGLFERLQKEPALRAKAIPQIKKSLYGFAEQAFELTPQERKSMRVLLPPEVAKLVGQSITTTLESGGKIAFLQSTGGGGGCKIVTKCSIDSTGKVTCGVELDCPLDP